MNREEFNKHIEEFRVNQDNILHSKGLEYSRSEDVLANFKRTAEAYGITPLQAWGSHFDKHVDAIKNYCKTGATTSNEGIMGRILDASNYLLLLMAMIEEGLRIEEPR